MANRRLSMRKIKEVLRLKGEKGFSARQIAKSCDIARSTVKDYLDRADLKGLTWPLTEDLDDAAVEHMLFPPEADGDGDKRLLPSMEGIHQELRKKGVTLQLLWYEYKQVNPDGYQYSQFCKRYHQWTDKLDACLRQTYRAGEKLFVDYAGQTIPITDSLTGTIRDAYLFVATLGASNYTFAWASFSQDLPSWISAHVRALDFFGAVPEIITPDNLLSGVTKPCYYEPDINPTYLDLALHYGTVIIPTRVGKAKDKAKVEAAVKIAEMWILAALRNHTFFSLAELNKAVVEKLIEFNNRKFKKMEGTRRSLFETIDKPAMKPLPLHVYEYAEWKKATVNIDYHVEVDAHYYSVPYQLIKERVDVRLTASAVEVLFKNKRVASHVRSYNRWQHTTLAEHMPKSHQKYLEWTPSRIVAWAGKNGLQTETLVSRILESRRHPEQGFRSCMGVMRLAKHYSAERLEAACARALFLNACSYKHVKSILEKGLDKQPLSPASDSVTPVLHDNIRGKDYYQQLSASACAESLSAGVSLPAAPVGQEGTPAEKEADHA
jgi:transposase